MDLTTIQGFISVVGVPTACCGGLFWMINTTMKDLRKAVEENTKATVTLAEKVSTYHND